MSGFLVGMNKNIKCKYFNILFHDLVSIFYKNKIQKPHLEKGTVLHFYNNLN